ncbi:MAG: hypothetical protein AAF376_12610 [Pseudomonadota bacterium]
MTGPTPDLIADSFVTAASVIGLVLFRQILRAERSEAGSSHQFIFAINVIIVVMASRLLQWFTGWYAAGALTYVAACFIPLAALLVTENVLRRHAPFALKIWVTLGAAALSIGAVFEVLSMTVTYIYALAAFQFLTFAALGVLVVRRDRGSLSATENAMVDRLALSLLFILPFAVTDFRTEVFDAPVRMSGIAVLLLCWLAIGLRRGTASQSGVIASLLAPALAIGVAALAIALLTGLEGRAMVQVVAIMVSAGLVSRVAIAARDIRSEERSGGLLRYVATAPMRDHAGFLAGLQHQAPTSGALILDAASLADFDTAFRAQFDVTPVLRKTDIPKLSVANLAEQADWFFRKYDATHAVLVSRTPFRLMALNIPALTQSDEVEHELSVVQRMAVLLAEAEAAHV